jgi:hypothetical protein
LQTIATATAAGRRRIGGQVSGALRPELGLDRRRAGLDRGSAERSALPVRTVGDVMAAHPGVGIGIERLLRDGDARRIDQAARRLLGIGDAEGDDAAQKGGKAKRTR